MTEDVGTPFPCVVSLLVGSYSPYGPGDSAASELRPELRELYDLLDRICDDETRMLLEEDSTNFTPLPMRLLEEAGYVENCAPARWR